MFFLVLLAVIGAGTTGIALENLDDEEVFPSPVTPFLADEHYGLSRACLSTHPRYLLVE